MSNALKFVVAILLLVFSLLVKARLQTRALNLLSCKRMKANGALAAHARGWPRLALTFC